MIVGIQVIRTFNCLPLLDHTDPVDENELKQVDALSWCIHEQQRSVMESYHDDPVEGGIPLPRAVVQLLCVHSRMKCEVVTFLKYIK